MSPSPCASWSCGGARWEGGQASRGGEASATWRWRWQGGRLHSTGLAGAARPAGRPLCCCWRRGQWHELQGSSRALPALRAQGAGGRARQLPRAPLLPQLPLPRTCMSEVQSVRLSLSSCMISVLSLYDSSPRVSSSAIASSNACAAGGRRRRGRLGGRLGRRAWLGQGAAPGAVLLLWRSLRRPGCSFALPGRALRRRRCRRRARGLAGRPAPGRARCCFRQPAAAPPGGAAGAAGPQGAAARRASPAWPGGRRARAS
jgi:hypothetical protein